MYAELEQKVCPHCKVAKEKKEFGRDSTTSSGYSSHCKTCKKKLRSEDRQEFKAYWRQRDFESDLMRNYGLTLEEYGHMYNNQEASCDCCGQHERLFKRGLHVDHSRITGQVRALLCTQCNPGIGYFQHDTERLEMAITYLNKFKK